MTDKNYLTPADYTAWPQPDPEHKIAYGKHPQQFGYLFLPDGEGPHPVIVFIHGGCYLPQYDIHPCNRLCEALARAGVAVWSIEYRRRDKDGAWPNLFYDVGAGADYLHDIAQQFNLDLNRVVASGHSAGGHLALWLAGRHRLSSGSTLFKDDPLKITSVVGLAPLADTVATANGGLCDNTLLDIIGGLPEEFPERYREVSPLNLLPLGVPQTLIVGAADGEGLIAQNKDYQENAATVGDSVELILVQEAAHFEVVNIDSPAWKIVQDHIIKAALS